MSNSKQCSGTHPSLSLESASIDWRPLGPETHTYHDRYFHPEDGAGESRYVFLEKNQLTERFKNLGQTPFVIVETGFGTGLNCLEAIALFETIAPPWAQLQIISVDLHPLKKTDLIKAAQQWPHLASYYETLIDHYPPLIRGTHSLRWPGRSIELILHWGELNELLENLVPHVDCWFLDGFAPSKNPDMWTDQLFHRMAELGTSETTFATFTAASAVRRGLAAAGFEVIRSKGFGHKRHMLHGQLAPHDPIKQLEHRNCDQRRNAHFKKAAPETIAVVGAGIAGLSTAITLQQAGYHVQLIEAQPAPCFKGSGNWQAALYTRFSTSDQPINRFHNCALPVAFNRLRCLSDLGLSDGFNRTALYEIISDEKADHWYEQLKSAYLDSDWISLTSSDNEKALKEFLPTQTPLLKFSKSGWVSPKELANTLSSTLKLPPWYAHRVTKLTPAIQGGWHITLEHLDSSDEPSTAQGIQQPKSCSITRSFDGVILCCPDHIQQLLPELNLPLRALPGQVNQIPQSVFTQTFNCVLTGPCTVFPAVNGQHTCGSSYRPGSHNESLIESDSQLNLDKIRGLSPAFGQAYAQLKACELPARAATRWNTSDYLPLVGPATHPLQTRSNPAPNLWLNTGHGSRGFTQCWLSADILLAYIQGRQFPICKHTRLALHPDRFALRKKKIKRPRKKAQQLCD